MPALPVQTLTPQAPPLVITIAGEIDIATAPALRRHLLSVPDGGTVLELSGVRLLSAAGLSELIDLHDRLTRAGARLALVGASPSVRRVLTITGLDDTLMLAGTLHDAIQLVTAPIPRPPWPLSLVSESPSCGGTSPPPATDTGTSAYPAAERHGQDGPS